MGKRNRHPIDWNRTGSLRNLRWGIVICIVFLCLGCVLLRRQQESREEDWRLYEGLQSELNDIGSCYLCGSSNESLMDYYRKFDTLGVVSVNDWYILDFNVKNFDEEGKEIMGEDSFRINYGNTECLSYKGESNPSRGRASIEAAFPEGEDLNTELLQGHLCQRCLDKVSEALECKKENGNKIPLCLIDFQTLQVYSLQEGHGEYWIRDYLAEMDFEKDKIKITVSYLPERKPLEE